MYPIEIMTESCDVIVIGAGAAGLTAARQLAGAGLRVAVLEARDRIGGRIWTIQPASGVPVELGAEFIHGHPSGVFDLVAAGNLDVHEFGGPAWVQVDGELTRRDDFFAHTRSVLEKMDARGPDRSFANFLDMNEADDDDAKLWGLEYVEGFHGALAERISVHSLVRDIRAEREVEGAHTYRLRHGYQALLKTMLDALPKELVSIHLNTVVNVVRWTKHRVEVSASTGNGADFEFTASAVVITLPLGVLQAPHNTPGAVSFEPPLLEKSSALHLLYMGQTIRSSLIFSEPWWEHLQVQDSAKGALRDMGFVFSHQEWFPTWWTRVTSAPVLTGWAASRRGERLSGRSESFIRDKALESLASLFHVPLRTLQEMLQSSHVHDWQSDPYARGSYSYVGVGGDRAQSELAAPIMDTLFFAGEATNCEGHHGTVHGAIATGERAADEILIHRT